jgi:hypothetical protein
MRAAIALQKCWNHPAREAVARCPECGHSYCRECVVDHNDRLICAGCLGRLTAPAAKSRRGLSVLPLVRLGTAILGLLIAWFVFFGIGRMLLSVPDSFRADTLWDRALKETWMEDGP